MWELPGIRGFGASTSTLLFPRAPINATLVTYRKENQDFPDDGTQYAVTCPQVGRAQQGWMVPRWGFCFSIPPQNAISIFFPPSRQAALTSPIC